MFEQNFGIRNALQELDVSTASYVEGARSSLSQQVDNVARIQQSNSAEYATALGRIERRLKPVSDSNTLIMDELDQMLRLLATKQVDERSTFQTTSTEVMTRVIRAELRRVIPPLMEEHLDPYKSNQHIQLERINKDLDHIVSDLGHLSAKEAACANERGQKPEPGPHSSELRNYAIFPHHESLVERDV